MSNNNLTITQFIEKLDAGKFDSADVKTQIDAGWYDWFCNESSLRNKTLSLGKKLKQISESSLFDNDKCYVFFKNNCPMNGSLFDDFRICDMVTHDVLYTVIPANGHTSIKGRAEVYGRSNNFDEPLAAGKWADVKKFFKGE